MVNQAEKQTVRARVVRIVVAKQMTAAKGLPEPGLLPSGLAR